ncbi:MAG: queuosine precursor transporter [Bacteroidia bacterium]|nr:queuosine precursor transporter [Bacteroidia bacterium]MCF8427537.1 queuosine precursor transporter [Bacteroidia bacterium]
MKENKRTILFLVLGSFFIANAIIAEFIGVKIFSLEKTLGLDQVNWMIFGNSLSFNMTVGVILWPIVFIMTDIINEYFGQSGVKLFSYIAAGLVAYAFIAIYLGIGLKPADFWIEKQTATGTINMQSAYSQIFGQGMWIIVGSLVAFLFGQVIDVWVFHYVKKKTGEKNLWLRATGSTLVSQLIDSFVVLFIAFYIGAGWDMKLVLGISLVNYIYKFTVALLLTPVLYGVHSIIDSYLGKELAESMMREAHEG